MSDFTRGDGDLSRRLTSTRIQTVVPVLMPYSTNHLDWVMLMTDCLRADGLAEGTTFDPDPFLMQAALQRLVEKPQQERQTMQQTGADLILKALMTGNDDAINEELLKAQQAGPTPTRVSPARVSPMRFSAPSRTPLGPSAARRNPLFSTPSHFQPRPRATGYYSDLARGSGDDEQQEDDGSEVAISNFMRKNARALQMIRQTIHPTLRQKFIKTVLAAHLWIQLKPVQDFDQCRTLADAGRSLKLTHPSGWQAYMAEIWRLNAMMLQVKDHTRSDIQRTADLLSNAVEGLAWKHFLEVIRAFNKPPGQGPERTLESFEQELREHCAVALRYSREAPSERINFGAPTQKAQGGRFSGACHTCGKTGHRAVDCRSKPPKGDKPDEEQESPTVSPTKFKGTCNGCGKVGHRLADCRSKNKDTKAGTAREISCMMFSLGRELTREEYHQEVVNLLDRLPQSTYGAQGDQISADFQPTKLSPHRGEPTGETPDSGEEKMKEESVGTPVADISKFLPSPIGETPFDAAKAIEGISKIPSVGILLGGTSTGPIKSVRGKPTGSTSEGRPKVHRHPMQGVSGWPNNAVMESLFNLGPRQPVGASQALLPRSKMAKGTADATAVEATTGVVTSQHPQPRIHGGGRVEIEEEFPIKSDKKITSRDFSLAKFRITGNGSNGATPFNLLLPEAPYFEAKSSKESESAPVNRSLSDIFGTFPAM